MAAVPSIGRASRIEGGSAPEADLTRALYEQYANQIFRYCLHQLGSREEAEDAVQSTFLNAFRGIRRGVVPELEAAWLFKIAHNVCLSRRRSTWRRGRIESPADFEVVEELAPAPSRRADELIGLQDVLGEMPENQRRAILLREWQGLSYREIAEELEVSQGAVETLIFRARRGLAQGLEQPPEPKRKRLARAADFGNILAGIKSALVGGGAAVKVAATVAVVSGSTVVATAPVQPHFRSHQPTAPPPAPKTSSPPASSRPSVVPAASPAGGLRPAVKRRGTQGLAAGTRDRPPPAAAVAPAVPPPAAPVVEAPPAETPAPAAPAAPVEQAPPSQPEPQPAPPAPAPPPAAAAPEKPVQAEKQDKVKNEKPAQPEQKPVNEGPAEKEKKADKRAFAAAAPPLVDPATTVTTVPTVTTPAPVAETTTTPAVTTPAPAESTPHGNNGNHRGRIPAPILPAPPEPTVTTTTTPVVTAPPVVTVTAPPPAGPSGYGKDKGKGK